MSHRIDYLSNHIVSEWRPVVHWSEIFAAADSQKPPASLIIQMLQYGRLLGPITGYWQAVTQYSIR
jgi:protein-L-isoaspartate O-methyltransferase